MDAYPHAFEGEIVTHDVGSERYLYTVVWLDRALHDVLPLKQYPRLRIEGELGEMPFAASLTPVRGDWYILLSQAKLEEIGATLGDMVEVRFAIADQDAVEVPPALMRALSEDPAMDALWQAATPGKRRGLAHMVASAKTEPTQVKRVAKVFAVLRGEIDMKGNPL